jgi:hypothetical protein
MQTPTRVELLRIAGVVSALPIVFLLFVVSVSLDRGLLGWFLVVVVPLALYGLGLFLLLRGLGSSEDDSGDGSGTQKIPYPGEGPTRTVQSRLVLRVDLIAQEEQKPRSSPWPENARRSSPSEIWWRPERPAVDCTEGTDHSPSNGPPRVPTVVT